MELFLFTNFFPFKRSEPFLVNEFPYTKNNFKKITVLSLYGKKEESIPEVSRSCNVLNPVFPAANRKSEILLKGIFNTSDCSFHLRELFKKNILLKPKRLYWFLISFCITRAALSSSSFKSLLADIERAPNPVLYFYWGDNLTWMIPYLKKKIKNRNLRIVVRLHGSDLYESLKGDYAPLRNEIFSAADRLFTVSEFGKKYLDQRYPQYSDKIRVSRLGIADHGINVVKSDKTFRILSVSNLVPLKRVELIYEALQLLDFPVEWHHYGDGPLAAELKERIKMSKKNITIIFHGFVKNADLINELQTRYFDVFINVSTSEGLPVSIMEAFSFGIPAIATNVGGTSELVDETTGKLLPKEILAVNLASEIEIFYKDNNPLKRASARERYCETVNAEKNYSAFYRDLKQL